MDALYIIVPFLVPVGLLGVLVASVPAGWEIFRRGNSADPLRREMEGEREARERDRSAARAGPGNATVIATVGEHS